MDMNKLPTNLLGILPGPVVKGVATALALVALASIATPTLLTVLDADLPLRVVTQYLILVINWMPYPAGVIVFGFYLWKAIATARRDNRR